MKRKILPTQMLYIVIFALILEGKDMGGCDLGSPFPVPK